MTAHGHLDDVLEQRRTELGLLWREVATAAGVSLAGLGAIRRGERRPMALTRRGIENALHWETGSVAAVLAGGDPTPRQPAPEPAPEPAPIDDDPMPENPFADPDEAYIWELTELPTWDRRDFIGRLRRARLRAQWRES